MKRKLYISLVMFASLAIFFNSCNQSELEDLYADPGKSSVATVEQMFTGVLREANNVVLPWYWRFFVIEQPTMGHYTQTMGWQNGNDQYLVPAQAIDWRWAQYYNMLTNYRVFETLYGEETDERKEEIKVFALALKVFFYDQTQQVVDIYGDIPWSEAGKVRELGDLDAALPKYDDAKTIYETMIADLKTISDDLGGITLDAFTATTFQDKDYLNDGDVELWRKYANSLRLRMLMRMSDVADVSGQVSEILGNTGQYPIIEANAENVMLDAWGPDLYSTTSSQTGGIRQAMETWGQYDIAPKAVCDFMVNNADPRLEIMFDPNDNGEYAGMDPLMDAGTQTQLLADGMIAKYDTSTFIRNSYFPGFVIGAAEVSMIKAEAIEKGYVGGDAKAAYNMGIEQSIEFYYVINAAGEYRAPIPMDPAAVAAYLNAGEVSWDANGDKMNLIATQKWLNSGLGSMPQTWAELRRLDKPVLDFMPDNVTASGQTLPPFRWLYPSSENALNADNYAAVVAKDNLNTKIFWDAN